MISSYSWQSYLKTEMILKRIFSILSGSNDLLLHRQRKALIYGCVLHPIHRLTKQKLSVYCIELVA